MNSQQELAPSTKPKQLLIGILTGALAFYAVHISTENARLLDIGSLTWGILTGCYFFCLCAYYYSDRSKKVIYFLWMLLAALAIINKDLSANLFPSLPSWFDRALGFSTLDILPLVSCVVLCILPEGGGYNKVAQHQDNQ